MKVHSNDFKEEIKQLGKQQAVLIEFGDTTLTNEYINSANPSYEGSLLKSVMKQLELDSNIEIPVGTEINFKYGLLIDGDYEYIDYGKYIVKEVERQEDTKSFLITCYDKLLYSMREYESFNITYPITIREYIARLCNHLGLIFENANSTFVNHHMTIPVELYLDSNGNDIGYTFRDVLDELAQATASTICINNNDKLEIRYITNTNDTINEQYLKDTNVNFGKKYGKINSIVLSRAGESDNVYLRDENSVEENGLCELKIVENQIMNFNNRDEFLAEIFNKLNGTEYYLNDFTSTGIMYYDLCDRYNVQIGENTYSCVMLNDDCNITQGLEEIIYTEELETSETDYTKADKTDRKINQTYLIVDKQNQQIEAVISQTTEQNEKINRVTQTVDELNSKISDIADITISKESNEGFVEFEKVNQSEPIRLVIRPIVENISYLYPSDNLFPSDTLFPKSRTIRFENITNETYIDYELPTDLLYYDNQNYDEFILDYDAQTCLVNKKVGYNADGTTYVLETPLTLEYNYPQILLEDGDYKISVLGYSPAYIFARVMSQNIYTTQFATKAEVSSSINQTAQSINLSVDKKLTNYSTTTEMNSAINMTANQITSTVSATYATKGELNTTKTEIKQTTDSITSTVSTKVGNNEIISKINQSAEAVTINANKISLNGKTINLTGDDVRIASDKCNISNDGTLTCTNANITGIVNATSGTFNGDINIYSGNRIAVYNSNGYRAVELNRYGLNCNNNYGTNYGAVTAGEVSYGGSTYRGVALKPSGGNALTVTPSITFCGSSSGLYAYSYNQLSKEEFKKDIKEFDENVLENIKKTKIYTFKYKEQKNENLGLIIGEKYNTPERVMSSEKNSIDLYSMTAYLWKAIQEQQEQIELLQEEINKLKGEK